MDVVSEKSGGRDGLDLAMPVGDGVSHQTHWRLEKRHGDIDAFIKENLPEDLRIFRSMTGCGRPERMLELLEEKTCELAERFHDEVDPYEVLEFDGNILVTVGIDILLDLLIGGGGTVFSNANAYLGVGDSSTAAAVGQTDLQAASNKLRKVMNGSYPAVASPKVTFQSTYGSSEANFTWNEVGTFNAASGGIMLNRKVQALGTKSSGATWTLTEDITFS